MNKYEELAKELGIIDDKSICYDGECEEKEFYNRRKDEILKSRADSILCLTELLTHHYRASQNKDNDYEELIYTKWKLETRVDYLEEQISMLKKVIDKLAFDKGELENDK